MPFKSPHSQKLQKMALKSFHLSFSSLAIPNSCFKNGQENNTHPIPWLLLIVISSFFVYAVCYGFHLLSFLLSCSTLLISTFALPLLRADSITSVRNTKTKLNSVLKEEEPIIQELIDNDDPDTDLDSDSDSDPTQDCSDESKLDEESLIEIELPSGYYIDLKKQEFDHHQQQPVLTMCGIQQKLLSSFQQQKLMAELLAEINEFYEEENMIEIDLSMGLIKCPRFEIKA